MNNIFENAKFGDVYWTAPEPKNGFPNGRPALFSRFLKDDANGSLWAILYLDRSFCEINVTLDGRYFDWVNGKMKFWDDKEYPFIVGRKRKEDKI